MISYGKGYMTTIKRKKDKFQDVLPTQDVLPY